MKLYYAPGVCSMAAHITAVEAGIPLNLVKVDIRSEPHRIEDGRDLKQVSSKGVVPVLELDDGQILTEGVAILHYLADQKPEAMLAPAHPVSSTRRRPKRSTTNNASTVNAASTNPITACPPSDEPAEMPAFSRIVGP